VVSPGARSRRCGQKPCAGAWARSDVSRLFAPTPPAISRATRLRRRSGRAFNAMSDPTNRRNDRSRRPPEWELEIIDIVDRIRRHSAAEEQVRRQRDVRAELASAMRRWFAGELGRLTPTPHQPTDSVLGHRIGLPHTGELVNKRSAGMGKFFGRMQRQYLARGGMVADVEIGCPAIPPAALAKATERAGPLAARSDVGPRSGGWTHSEH
jgi:hypothetical protein